MAGNVEEALAWYQRAISCSDADDSSATWFGNALHNERRHVDATEVYLLASILDPDDATGFAHVADELSIAMRHERIESARGGITSTRRLPGEITEDAIKRAFMAAFSCRLIDQEDVDRCKRAARIVQIDLTTLIGVRTKSDEQQMSVHERPIFASEVYAHLRSHLTDGQAAAFAAVGRTN